MRSPFDGYHPLSRPGSSQDKKIQSRSALYLRLGRFVQSKEIWEDKSQLRERDELRVGKGLRFWLNTKLANFWDYRGLVRYEQDLERV